MITMALHGGFRLGRHYAAFAGVQHGAGVRDSLDRLVSRRLATRLTFRPDRGHVCHMNHSGLYDAIGQAGANASRAQLPSRQPLRWPLR